MQRLLSVTFTSVCVSTCVCTLCRCVCVRALVGVCLTLPPKKLLESLRRRAAWRLGTDVFHIPQRRKEKQREKKRGTARPSVSIGPEPRLARPPGGGVGILIWQRGIQVCIGLSSDWSVGQIPALRPRARWTESLDTVVGWVWLGMLEFKSSLHATWVASEVGGGCHLAVW